MYFFIVSSPTGLCRKNVWSIAFLLSRRIKEIPYTSMSLKI
jgi:hypothetical protein